MDVSGSDGDPAQLRGLACDHLIAHGMSWGELPEEITVRRRLDLTGCRELARLPAGLNLVALSVSGCTSLTSLPEGVRLNFLDASDSGLTAWPREGSIRFGHVSLSGCAELEELPEWLTDIAQLDVSGCSSLRELPPTLRVNSFIEVADSGLVGLPRHLADVEVRWRGVPVPADVAFRPETITADAVIDPRANIEYRRVLLERMGLERFLESTNATELDRDADVGGERRLLRVEIEGDEDLVCVLLRCPSTARTYAIRVPPTMTTCRQAVAWMAGFEDPKDYAPIVET